MMHCDERSPTLSDCFTVPIKIKTPGLEDLQPTVFATLLSWPENCYACGPSRSPLRAAAHRRVAGLAAVQSLWSLLENSTHWQREFVQARLCFCPACRVAPTSRYSQSSSTNAKLVSLQQGDPVEACKIIVVGYG